MRRVRHSIDTYNQLLGENPEIGTKFKPEPPFEMFTRGFVYPDKRDNRRSITLYTPAIEHDNKTSIKKNMLVGTYLYAVKLFKETGQHIPDGYQVDHIDDDKHNDTYENLQLLTSFENAKKEGLRVGCTWYVMVCPVCKKQWKAQFNNTQLIPALKETVFYCSSDCKIIFRSTLFPFKDFLPLRQWIAKHQLYKIVKVWKEENREELVKICSEEMLNFDLAIASGREVKTDTLRLLDELSRINYVKELRQEGKSWEGIGLLFNMSGGQAHRLYASEENGKGVGGRKQFIYSEIIRLFDEGKTKFELAELFKMHPDSISRISREKRQT